MNPTPDQLNADAQLGETVGADRNGPVSRFADIQYGFQSVGMLSNAIRQNMNAPLPEPRCTGRDVAHDYENSSSA